MKKRLLSLLLAVCVMTAMVPVMTTEARADTVPDKIVGYLESYIMQAGDTVIAVCNKKGIDFGTNANYIARINNITNYSNMKVGQSILLPVKKTSNAVSHYTLLQHTLTAGETLQSLCLNYGINADATTTRLMQALNTNYNSLIAGQTFVLPIYVAAAGTPTPTPAATPVPTATPAPGTTAAPTATPAPTNTDPVKFYLKHHIMQAGETVYGVCADNGLQYNEVFKDLEKYNPGVGFNPIYAGTVLRLPVNAQPSSGSYDKIVEHTVVAGDTMYGLCINNGIDYTGAHKLMEALNNNPYVDWLVVGHKLLLPIPVKGTVTLPLPGTGTGGTTVTPAPATPGTGGTTVTPAPGTTAAPVVTATPAPSTNDPVKFYLKQYIVQAGDTMTSICAANGLDYILNYEELDKYNTVPFHWRLMIGDVLWLPTNTQPSSGTYYKILEHTVVAGDTVYGLCAANGLLWGNVEAMLTTLNPSLHNIYPGNKLLIPVLVKGAATVVPPAGGTTTTPAPIVTAPPPAGGTTTPAPTGGTATTAPTATPVPTGDYVKYYMELYTIQPGDTMSGICAAKGVQYEQVADLITKFNKEFNVTVNANHLIANTKIWFPVTVQPAAPYYKLIQHQIVAGDTLMGLCDANGISYWDSLKLIEAVSPNAGNLIVGQSLLLPVYVK